MALSALIRNKQGLIRTDCVDGETRYLTDDEFKLEMKKKQLRRLNQEKKGGKK
jgi:hypothetical protein